MSTQLRNRKPREWLALIPSPAVLRARYLETEEELRQLKILLQLSEDLERAKVTVRPECK